MKIFQFMCEILYLIFVILWWYTWLWYGEWQLRRLVYPRACEAMNVWEEYWYCMCQAYPTACLAMNGPDTLSGYIKLSLTVIDSLIVWYGDTACQLIIQGNGILIGNYHLRNVGCGNHRLVPRVWTLQIRTNSDQDWWYFLVPNMSVSFVSDWHFLTFNSTSCKDQRFLISCYTFWWT